MCMNFKTTDYAEKADDFIIRKGGWALWLQRNCILRRTGILRGKKWRDLFGVLRDYL